MAFYLSEYRQQAVDLLVRLEGGWSTVPPNKELLLTAYGRKGSSRALLADKKLRQQNSELLESASEDVFDTDTTGRLEAFGS